MVGGMVLQDVAYTGLPGCRPYDLGTQSCGSPPAPAGTGASRCAADPPPQQACWRVSSGDSMLGG